MEKKKEKLHKKKNRQPPPENIKVIFKSSLSLWKAIDIKDHIGTFYSKSGLITVFIKNKS